MMSMAARALRYVALVVSAATFWLTILTLRLMVHGNPYAAPPGCLRSQPADWGDRLPGAEVDAVLGALRARIAACEDHASTGSVTVDLKIAPDGTVGSANHHGTIAGTLPAYCVTDLLLSTRFRASKAGYQGSHSFDMH
jgi:hypothetical protein